MPSLNSLATVPILAIVTSWVVTTYDEHEVLSILEQQGLELIEVGTPDKLVGIMYFTDPKLTEHCVFFTRKVAWL